MVTTNTNNNEIVTLDPYYITGFSDGESTFIVSLTKDNEYKTGWRVGLAFAIGLHEKDVMLLEHIKSKFKVGSIRFSKSNKCAFYSVQSVKDISNVIIPHFDKYPLLTQKRADFELFKSAVDLINRKVHRTPEGLQEIVNIRAHPSSEVPSKEFGRCSQILWRRIRHSLLSLFPPRGRGLAPPTDGGEGLFCLLCASYSCPAN